jgi:hypothetical protein
MFAQHGAVFATAEKEAVLGAAMAGDFRERHGTLDNREAQTYLDRIVRELVAAQPGGGHCCSVELYASANAAAKPTAFPGGYLFVPARLFSNSPDEEAFVHAVAHAVAHVRQRDWVPEGTVSYANIPLIFAWAMDDEAESIPLGMRAEFEARERRAEEAAAQSGPAVTTGTGEFERLRPPPPPPRPRPSLLP